LYVRGLLSPETVLTGHFEHKAGAVDVSAVIREIDDAQAEEQARRIRMSTTK
jgi:RIO kinase 1